MKKTLVAAAVSLALGIAAGNATASIYAHSLLDISDLQIGFFDDGIPTSQPVASFSFDTTNTAFLNGVGGANNDACGGTPASNDCGGVRPSGVANVTDAAVLNAGASAPTQGENSFTLQGPGADTYSWADSVITSAQLVTGTPTSTRQGNESELQASGNASANTNIQSITAFDMEFTVAGADGMVINFNADASMRAAILGEPDGTYGSLASMAVTFLLSNDDNGSFVRWAPDGTVVNNCATFSIGPVLSCNETFDSEDIGSNSVNASTNGTDDKFSELVGFLPYGILIGGLYDGNWTLTLRAETSDSLSANIPVPGTLLLFGLGLMGLASSTKRRA